MNEIELLKAENKKLREEIAAMREAIESLVISEEEEIAKRDVARMEAIISELYEPAFEVCRICECEGLGN